MHKRIAIDINDVLRDFTGQIINTYAKHIDEGFELSDEEITTNDYKSLLNFATEDEYRQFLYIDYPYEIYARAEATDKTLAYRFNDWLLRDMRDFEKENTPEIMLVSPFEANLTIQATLVFLSKLPSRVREIYFPIDSSTVWDRCDILITANPLFLSSVPEGKTVVKINKSYNKDIETEYVFDSMSDVIKDEDNIFYNLIEDE